MPRQLALATHWSLNRVSFDGVSRDTHDAKQLAVHAAFAAQAGGRVHVIDLAEPFFDENGISKVGRDGVAWYSDEGHVSPIGAREALGPLLRQLLGRMAVDCETNLPR